MNISSLVKGTFYRHGRILRALWEVNWTCVCRGTDHSSHKTIETIQDKSCTSELTAQAGKNFSSNSKHAWYTDWLVSINRDVLPLLQTDLICRLLAFAWLYDIMCFNSIYCRQQVGLTFYRDTYVNFDSQVETM